jgi:hypothetical protein
MTGLRMQVRRLLATAKWQEALPANKDRQYLRVAISKVPGIGSQTVPGASFDGVSTTAHPPTLSNANETAQWPIAFGSFITPFVKSTLPVSGKYFVAMQAKVTGSYNAEALIGFANSNVDVNNPGTLGGNVALVGAGTFGTTNTAVGADSALLDLHALANNDVLFCFVDTDAQTWGCVVPGGTTYNNLQAMLGVGGHPLGFPAGGLTVLGGIFGTCTAGSGTISLNLLTDTAITALAMDARKPAGYANLCNSVNVTGAADMALDTQGNDFETVLTGVPFETRVAPTNKILLRATPDPINPAAPQSSWVTIWEG